MEILTPFETSTHCIQGDKVVTSSMVESVEASLQLPQIQFKIGSHFEDVNNY